MAGVKLTVALVFITLIYYFVLGLLISNMPTEKKMRMREFDEYSNGLLLGAFGLIVLVVADFIGIGYSLIWWIWLS